MQDVRRNPGPWAANLVLVVGLVLFAVLATLLEDIPGFMANPVTRYGLLGLVALLPPLLWLMLFYRLDRRSPEPKEDILKMAVLGVLVQLAVCAPLRGMFPEWDGASWLPQSAEDAAGILAVNAMRVSLLLLALMAGVFRLPTFDEKTDGILYGSAVGLGFAVAMNLSWALSASDALLSAAAPRMVVNALVLASIGGLGGFWMGLAAFDRLHAAGTLLKILLLSLLGMAFQILPAAMVRQGFQVRPLVALIPSVIGAAAIFAILLLLLRRHGVVVSRRLGGAAGRTETFLLWGVLIVSLASAFSLQAWQERLVRHEPSAGITFSAPADWQRQKGGEAAYVLGDRFRDGHRSGELRFEIRKGVLAETVALGGITRTSTGEAASGGQADGSMTAVASSGTPEGEAQVHRLAAWWTMRAARENAWWQPKRTDFLYRDGVWLAVVTSMRLDAGASGGAGSQEPVLRECREVLWQTGEDVYLISLYGCKSDGAPDERLMSRIVASIRHAGSSAEGGAQP